MQNNMKKSTRKHITQLDYIKVLLEEDRIGEALNYVNILSNSLETQCENIVEKLDISTGLAISKTDLKTKPGNWMYIDNTWLKLVEKDKNNESIHLELTKNLEIKTKYIIVDEK